LKVRTIYVGLCNIYDFMTNVPAPFENLDCSSSVETMLTPTGTTRDNFNDKPVKELQYTSYKPKALQTMMSICKAILEKHSLISIALIHRLGVVPIGEESIHIAVSSPHRQAAWDAGQEALEQTKEKVEIWKREEFGGEEGGVWRANRDGAVGSKVEDKEGKEVSEDNPKGQEPSHRRLHAFGDPSKPKPIAERGHGPVVHPKRA
jgi:molybdopterin synthase catalytic subunit